MRIGIANIEVGFGENDSNLERTIEFEGDFDIVEEKLVSLGYPKVGSLQAKSMLKKAKSFVSCAVGKMK